MESDSELAATLRAAERAEAAPWTDYPPTPRWYPPTVGLWAALMPLLANQYDRHPVLTLIGLAALLAAEFGFLAWYRRYRGAMPEVHRPPQEFRPAISRFLLASVGILVGAWVTFTFVGAVASALVVFALTTALLTWYERAYAAAAGAARARLA